jgi:hypothetical protein
MKDLNQQIEELQAQIADLSKLKQANLNKEWLTPQEASIYTGYSISAVYKWSFHPQYSKGIIRARKTEGKVLFLRTELDQFINQRS